MHRIAFRCILPIVQLALAVGLLMIGEAQEQTLRAKLREHTAAVARSAQTNSSSVAVAGWDLESMWNGYSAPASELCFTINLPGMLLFLPIMAALIASGAGEQSWLLYVAYGLCIVVFWTWVGIWLDRERGLLPTRTKKLPGVVVRLLAWAGVVLLGGLALFLATVYLTVSIHDFPYLEISFVVWPTIVAVVLIVRIRRWRVLARSSSSSARS